MTKTAKIVKSRFPVSGSLADAVSAFYSVAQELRDEMQEAFDNTPESLQGSAVGEARQAAADALDSFVDFEPDIPEGANELTCSWTENRLRKASRRDRLEGGISAANAAISALEEKISQIDDDTAVTEGEEEHEAAEELKSALEELKTQLENDVEEAGSVEFPGMYG